MATTLVSASVRTAIKWDYQNDLDIGDAVDKQNVVRSSSYTDGESANQLEVFFRKSYAPVASATTSIDLSGSLTDAFGNALVLTTKVIKVLQVKNTGTTLLTVGGNAAAIPFFGAVGDFWNLPGGATLTFDSPITGIVVTAATGDILDVVNTSGSTAGAFDIIVGCTK